MSSARLGRPRPRKRDRLAVHSNSARQASSDGLSATVSARASPRSVVLFDFREPRPRRQHKYKICLPVRIEGEMESREGVQQIALIELQRLVAADQEFRPSDDVFAVDNAEKAHLWM